MAVVMPEQKLRDVVEKGQKLAAQGVRSADEQKAMEACLTEARELRAQIDANRSFGELNDWASQSAGMLPVVENLTPAGSTVVEKLSSGSLRLTDIYGDGDTASTVGQKMLKADSPAYRKAMLGYFRAKSLAEADQHIRTLQEASDTGGGFLVPGDFLEKVISKDPTPTRVYGKVTNLQTSRDSLTMPRINYSTDDLYTTGMRVTWTGENPAAATSARVTEPVFGQSQISIFTAMMSISLTNDLIEDSGFPLLDYVAGKFGETIELLRDNMILNGTGIGQPFGILVNPGGGNDNPATVKTGSATTIGTDGTFLIKLAYTLPEQYENNATFVFNKTNTGSAIAQMKDSEGRFLWGMGMQESGLSGNFMSRPLLGYPVTLSGFMPNVGSAAYPIIHGDLSGYYMVNRIGFSVQVLRELYAETNQIVVLGRIRLGGQVVEPWKMNIGYCAT